MDIAVPRPRARRRRRKPPPPSFWWALFWVLYDLAFIGLDMLWLLGSDSAFEAAFYSVFLVLFVRMLWRHDWPRFQRELNRWLEDE